MSTGWGLLIIDPQVDFHSGGSLAVPGADEDSRRIADLIAVHGSRIGSIIVTRDCHQPDHIAHAKVWEDCNGSEPLPFQQIAHQDVLDGLWRPKDLALQEHCLKYTREIEKKGNFVLTIWPPHCIEGSAGYEVVPSLRTALGDWSAQRGLAVHYVDKGRSNATEMYSALQAEVPMADDPQTQLNCDLLQRLQQPRKLVICGQALSHCVNWTVRHLLAHWAPRDPADIVLLTDGSSAVPGCDADAQRFVADMRTAGVATMSAGEWAGLVDLYN